MWHHTKVWLATVCLGLMWPISADSRGFRRAQYPNPNECEHCHAFPGGPRSNFGLDVEETLLGNNVDWAAIFDIDSDGDGYTNGEELGDAHGQWSIGDPDPTQLSEPHLAQDTPALVGNAPTPQDIAEAMLEDGSLEADLSAQDDDGDPLRFRLVSTPEGATVEILDHATGRYIFTPDPDAFGVFTFSFQAFDGNNIGANAGLVTVNVEPVNDPPTLSAGDDQTVDEGQTLSFDVLSSDVEDGTLNIEVDGLPRGAAFDGQTGTFVWDIDFLSAGSYELNFSATDEGGLSVSDTVRIEVENVNAPPSILLVDGTFEGDEGQSMTFRASVDDPDLDVLTYIWRFGDGDEFTGEDLDEVQKLFPQDGVIPLTLSVSDGIDTDETTLQITIANVTPRVEAGQNATINEGEEVALAGTFIDPGLEDEHATSWDFGDGQSESGLEVTHRYLDDGVYTATAIVTDDDSEGTDTLVVTVNNLPPEVDAGGDRAVDEGTPLTFPGAVDDPGVLDTHSFAWSFGDGGSSAEQTPTHTYLDQGTFTVSFDVEDDGGASDLDTIEVTVRNVAPQVVSQPPLYAVLERPYSYQIEAVDPGDDTLAFLLVSTAPEGLTMNAEGLITYTPPLEEENNTYTITAHVSDEDGGLTVHTYGLRIGLPDRDGDGADDECELRFDLDPDDPNDGVLDPDSDGLTNAEECQGGTNPRVSNAPQAPSVNAPFDGQLLNTPSVELVINNAEDPDGDPVTYAFELYRDRALTQPARQWEGVSEGVNLTRVEIDVDLEEDALYFWRARATDGRGHSPYTAVASFRRSITNDPPSVPVPIGPIGQVRVEQLVLSISAGIDPEGEIPIGHDFQVFDESMTLVDSVLGLPTQGAQIQWLSTFDYLENATYTWRARATDARGLSSDFCPPQTITINVINSAPPALELLSPDDGVTLDTIEALRFVAAAATDEDDDELTYTFRIATDETFSPRTLIAQQEDLRADNDGTVTYAAPSDLVIEEDGLFFWSVQASDGIISGQPAVRSFRFSAQNDPPGVVTLLEPARSETVGTLDPPFVWSQSLDPEAQPVVYRLEVYDDEGLTQRVRHLQGVSPVPGTETVTASVASLDDNTTYFWRVQAIDADLVEGDFSVPAQFTTATSGGAPSQPVIISPASGEVFATTDPIALSWENAADPEGQPLRYDVEVLDTEGVIITSERVDEAQSGGSTTHTLTLRLLAGDYTWRVRATDGGQTGPFSDSGAFRLAEPTAADEGCSMVSPSPRRGGPVLALLIAIVALLPRRRT